MCGCVCLQAEAEAQEAAGAAGGAVPVQQRILGRAQDGTAPRQRELTWALFEGLWKHKYERERKTDVDPKLIYQASALDAFVWLVLSLLISCVMLVSLR